MDDRSTTPRASVEVHGLCKAFARHPVLRDVSLEVAPGTVLALLGPSGCGKTTLLRTIAGLEVPDRGEIRVAGRVLAAAGVDVAPEDRRVGMVFQDWALFPHLDVRRNVAFGLPRHEEHRVDELLALVRLDGLGERMPHELSGGQQQRVALARALAPNPEVILLDEPFSNLDATLRARVRSEVREMLRALHATAVFVTHDQEEALSIADEVAVMDAGRILQVGPPTEVYTDPAEPRVAEILGDGNLLPAEVRDGVATTVLGRIAAPGVAEGPAEVVVRPEAIALAAEGVDAVVVDSEFYGHDQRARVKLHDGTLVDVRLLGEVEPLRPGARVRLSVRGRTRFFPRPDRRSA
ncbi:MAG TPA: ABC transporter ATP-binding protein [Actinomycetota bacterium]|nr:ABC transporter ATP-binding protein [Actinomycetota bacterium]